MDISAIIKENEELRQLLNLSGLPEEYRQKRAILHDLVAINTLILHMLNKAALMNIDLSNIDISENSLKGLVLPTKNIPILPLFKVKPEVLQNIISTCADDELYPHILREQLKFL